MEKLANLSLSDSEDVISPDCEASDIPGPAIEMVPYELLAEIMLLAVTPRHIGWPTTLQSASARDVLSLAQVCVRWRIIALHTAKLWVLDKFPIRRARLGPRQTSFSATNLFLGLSAPLPFNICLDPNFSSYSSEHPYRNTELPAILKALVRTTQRWRSFEMYTVHAGLDVPVLRQITAGSLDRLETLRLTLKNNQMDQPDEEWQSGEITTFEAAPQLREVHIEAWSATSYMLPMPWAQLTRLSLSYNLPQVCLDILVRCKRLVSATVHTKQWAEVDAPGAAHTLAQLETLDVHMDVWSEGEHLAPFLRRLKVPALKTLTLCLDFTQVGDEEYYIEWLAPDFANFLMQCPKIERLSLEECVFAADMGDILQHIPSLTELVFYDSSGNDELFAALQYSDTNHVHLVPKLETLGLLHVDEELADSETIFIEMLRSRWWSDEELLLKPSKPSVERLKSVTLKCDPYAPKVFSDDFLKAVTDCKAQGFQLTKTYY